MLFQLFHMPRDQHFYLACSSGLDSMSLADFYLRGSKNFSLAYFHHGTTQADDMLALVGQWCLNNSVKIVIGRISDFRPKDKDESPEEYWRKARYDWLVSLGSPIVTAHHLDDVVETWLFSALHGNPRLIASKVLYTGETGTVWIYRPFLATPKSELVRWCLDHGVKWLEDKSNQDTHYPRNRIRHIILPECLKVNPGLLKTLKKKILARDKGWIENEDGLYIATTST